MNEIKTLTLTFCRMYSRRLYNPLAGIRNKVEVMEKDADELVDLESFDIEDTNEYESDFMNLNQTHRMHERYENFIYYFEFCTILYFMCESE